MAKTKNRRCVGLCILLSLMITSGCENGIGDDVAGPSSPRRPVPPGFDRLINRMSAEWSIPGVAVAVIDGDETTFLGTYGVRERGGDDAVTKDTMFGIASITKALIAGGLGVLVDAEKLHWDDRVIDHLPEFRVADPYVTSNVTIRDLLVHRSGIASYGDWLEEIPGLSEGNALQRMQHLDQSSPFRYHTEYSSYAFIILTEIVHKVTGKPWGEFLDAEVWTPLGMNDTHAHADDFIASEYVLPTGDGWSTATKMGQAAVEPGVNVASPHVKWETFIDPALVFEQRELEFDVSHFHRTAIDPGQGAFSSVSDLAKWARVLLNDGISDGHTVLKPETVAEMRSLHGSYGGRAWPATAGTSCDTTRTDRRSIGVALGLFLYEYCGHILYGHSGGELGYESLMVIDPQQDFAVVALVNNSRSSSPTNAMVQTILDWRYGYEDRAWFEKHEEDAVADAQERFELMTEIATAQPEIEILNEEARSYVGRYHNPFAGTLDVQTRNGALVATTGESYFLELSYLGDDMFRATPVSPIRFWLTLEFSRNESGGVDELTVSHRYFHQPLRFTRVGKETSPAEGGPGPIG